MLFYLHTTPAVMAAEKTEHSRSQDSNNHAGKFVYPLSIFSFLICITAMVRVEIINQRIDVVEDFMAEVNQIAKVHVGRDVTGLKNVQRFNLVGEFYRNNGVKGEEYTSKGKLNPLQYFTPGGTPMRTRRGCPWENWNLTLKGDQSDFAPL